MISKTHKTFRFYWVHINLIQKLDTDQLNKYSESISLSGWANETSKYLFEAINIRKQELLKPCAMAVSSNISMQDL